MVNTRISTLNGRNGFTVLRSDENALLGDAVSTAGDINNDGIADIIIGARNTRVNNRSNSGKVYVIFGNNSFTGTLNPFTLDGTNGFTIDGLNSGDRLGISVSNAGDINNDGISDIIIGANGNNSDTGASYVVFGQDSFDGTINLSNLDGNNGFVVRGSASGDLFGTAVSSAGDINGDGIPDLIVSATEADSSENIDAGLSYVIFGSDNDFEADFNLASLDGSNGFVINGSNARDFSGTSVSSAGDVNGDGIDDLMIGADFADADTNRSNSGQVYILFGSSGGFSSSVNLSDLDGNNGFTVNGIESRDGIGVSVANAGDVNSDGFEDVIIGASFADADEDRVNSGQAYVVFGKDTGFSSTLELSDLNGSNGFIVNGIDTDDLLGSSVDGAGDVNNDNISDIIIGARGVNQDTGAGYVIFGREEDKQFPAVLEVADLTIREGFTINSTNTGSILGEAASGAGDVNGDGINDIIVGAPQSDIDAAENDNAGESYIIFGRITNPGDTNNDGAYTNEDVLAISRMAVGLDTEFSAYPGIDPVLVADVNGDGIISAFDASAVARVVNGLESPFVAEIIA